MATPRTPIRLPLLAVIAMLILPGATATLESISLAPRTSSQNIRRSRRSAGLGSCSANSRPEPVAAAVEPPADSDVIEEWEFFYGLAQRMGLQLRVNGVELEYEVGGAGEPVVLTYRMLLPSGRARRG